jgi:rhodanese-related sulfurtransferase
MKKLCIVMLILGLCLPAWANDNRLENYISSFDYTARKEMKMDSKGLISLLEKGEAQLVDIRFPEEYEAWKVGPSISIPLDELPARLNEIDRQRLWSRHVLIKTVPPSPWYICGLKGFRQNTLRTALSGLQRIFVATMPNVLSNRLTG